MHLKLNVISAVALLVLTACASNTLPLKLPITEFEGKQVAYLPTGGYAVLTSGESFSEYVDAEGSRYSGEFSLASLTGQARIEFIDGGVYQGPIINGKMHGEGVYTGVDGQQYVGEFNNDSFTGKGVWENEDKTERYEGDFEFWQFEGEGRLEKPKAVYTGSFQGGYYHGIGLLEVPDEFIYQGSFSWGEFSGEGSQTFADGSSYLGSFNYGKYAGKGVLTQKDGSKYIGEFNRGEKHGAGTSVTIVDGKSEITTGYWNYNDFSGENAYEVPSSDSVLFYQKELLDSKLARISSGKNKTADAYFIGMAGDGRQTLFDREVRFAEQVIQDKLATHNRTLVLSSQPKTLKSEPMGTTQNLDYVIGKLAAKMNLDQDVLILFLSSHGSRTHHFSVKYPAFSLRDLHKNHLSHILEKHEIKNKIVIISACYSGGFIPSLESDTSMIITAASHDNTSFGCDDERELTYFGEAFFKNALPNSADFISAFDEAKNTIDEWESAESLTSSDPQIFVGERFKPIYLQMVKDRGN